MKVFFSSLRWLVFLLLVWLAATAANWVLPAIAVFAPGGIELAEMEVTSVSWEGPEGNRLRCSLTGDIILADGEVITREIEVDEATADATSTGQMVAVMVNSWPGSSWFEGTLRRAALAETTPEASRARLLSEFRGLGLAVVLWAILAGLTLVAGLLRRATDAGVRSGEVLDLELSPSAGGCGSAVVAVGLALAVSVVLGWGGVWFAPIVLVLLGLLGWHRGSVRVDRRERSFAKVTELGPFRRVGPTQVFGAPTQVTLLPKKLGQGTQYALSIATQEGNHELGSFANYSNLGEEAEKLARYLGVGARITKEPRPPSGDEEEASYHDESADHESWEHASAGAAVSADPTDWATGRQLPPPEPQPYGQTPDGHAPSGQIPHVQVVGGEPAIPRFAIFGCGCLVLLGALALGAVGLGTSSLAAKGLDPALAGVPMVRELAAKTLASRDDEESQMALLRFLHTADPIDPAWRPALEATAAALEVELPDTPFSGSLLEPIDAAIAAKLGRPLEPVVGVFGWWGIDPGYTEVVERIAGADPELAVDAWASLGPPNPPTFEEALAALGPALADPRPIAFPVLVEGGQVSARSELYPGEVSAITNVGDAIAARLGLYGAWPQMASGDPIEAWHSAAAARGLPAVWAWEGTGD